VHGELLESRMPILMGGDHSLSIGSISAVARYCRDRDLNLRVLWLDAHADFNTHVLTPVETCTACRWPACVGWDHNA